MKRHALGWWAGAVLAVAAGVALARWMAPQTVSIPADGLEVPSAELPPPMPAPPALAAAPSDQAAGRKPSIDR